MNTREKALTFCHTFKNIIDGGTEERRRINLYEWNN